MGCLKLHIENELRLSLAYSKKEVKPLKNRGSYYPFGLQQKGYNNNVSANNNGQAEQFQYNGKELQSDLGLNLYDYHARMYDPTLGRMMQIDPHAHKYSPVTPYNYVLNSPLNFIDPDGKDFRLLINRDDDGNFHLTIQTTVNTFGDQSSEEEAAKIQEELGGLFKDSNQDGNTLSFDISVKHHDTKEDAEKATEDNAGDNLLELTSSPHDKPFSFYPNTTVNDNANGTAMIGGKEGKTVVNNRRSHIHEIGHLLGLDERYGVITVDGKEYQVGTSGFLDDIMGASQGSHPRTEVSNIHYANLYNFVKSDIDESNNGGDTRTIPYTNFGNIP